jgi:hypothetical protein
MRTRSVLTLAAVTTGITATVALQWRADRRQPETAAPVVPEAAPAPVADVVPDRDAVVLPFLRSVPAAPAEELPTAPTRCGDAGGRTKSGSPCAARATVAGRCHHHRLAA